MARFLARASRVLVCAVLPLAWPHQALADLPPPPAAAGMPSSMKLWLELVINSAPTGRVVPVEARSGRYLVATEDLRAVLDRVEADRAGPVDVGSLPGVDVRYDQARQRLLIEVPGDWLPHQSLGRIEGQRRLRPETSTGAVLNYDLYVSRAEGGLTRASLWNEVRVFGGFGLFQTTGSLQSVLSGEGGTRFNRYDTRWTYIDDEHVRTYEAGDIVTRNLPWTRSVRLGGLQLSRDFAVRPDIVTYPLPSFSGTAAVPSAVDLFINGQRTSGGMLAPGPYTISDVPFVNGAGEAVVVTTDAQGRSVSTSVPFYVASTLLRPGLSDYAISAGALRRDYGLRNFAYGPLAASAAYRHGLADWLTVEAQAQGSRGLVVGGVGGSARLGNLGVVEASVSVSDHDGDAGLQATFGYQYSGRHFNLAVRHVRRDDAFMDLGGLDAFSFRYARRETQVNGSVVLGPDLGTLSGGYIDSLWGDERFRLVNLSYHRSLWQRGSLMLTANHAIDRNETTALAQLVVSFGQGDLVTAGLEREPGGSVAARLGYSRAVPPDGGLGWTANLSRDGGGDTRYQTSLTWRTPGIQFQGGAYGGRGGDVQWIDASGALVMMGGSVMAANRIADAFALVSTNGVAGVPVLHENQRIGVTGRRGYLLVPSVNAYHAAKFGIDPLDLPADVSTPVVEQQAAVTLGGGRYVYFPIRRVAAATVLLHDAQGAPLPAGAQVRGAKGATFYVGWDGRAYLEDLEETNRVTVTLPDGSACRAEFPFAREEGRAGQIGPVTCR